MLHRNRDSFVAYMQDDQPLKPANILNIVATNQGKRPLTQTMPKAQPLSAQQVAQLAEEQAHIVVDCRSSAEFGAGHIAGAINVQLSSSEFEQRVGWMTPDDVPLILVTGKDSEAQHAIYNMAFIALDAQVVGFLKGGMAAWMEAGKPLVTVPQIDVHALRHRLRTNGLQVLDVRDREEWDEGHIADAHFMSYTSMVQQLDTPSQIDKLTIAPQQSVAVTCATGKRSSTAISVLLRHGYQHVYNVTGGMKAWEDAGFDMLDVDGGIVCKV